MERQKRLGKKVVEVEPADLMDASEALKRCICEASILAAGEVAKLFA